MTAALVYARVLPTCFQATQATFALRFFDRVERRRSGVEDIFGGGVPRWTATFNVAGDRDGVADWRSLVARLGGAPGLVLVHDVADLGPAGGVRTAAALAAETQSAVTWADGSAVTWADGTDPVTWDLLPDVPSVTALRLAATAAAGDETVEIEGLWPVRPGVIRAGEYVQIGHWLYVATGDAFSTAAGRAHVAIRPALRQKEQAGVAVVLDRPSTVMRLDRNEVGWSRAARDRRLPLTVTFSEVLPAETP